MPVVEEDEEEFDIFGDESVLFSEIGSEEKVNGRKFGDLKQEIETKTDLVISLQDKLEDANERNDR